MTPAPSSATTKPNRLTIRELNTAGKITRTVLGILLFLSWLLLFVFGMSLRAKDYRDCIFQNDVIDFKYMLLYAATFTPTNAAVLASLAGVLGGFASQFGCQ